MIAYPNNFGDSHHNLEIIWCGSEYSVAGLNNRGGLQNIGVGVGIESLKKNERKTDPDTDSDTDTDGIRFLVCQRMESLAGIVSRLW